MGFAYGRLNKTEKNNISKIVIDYAVNEICIEIRIGFLKTSRYFYYTQDFKGITTMVEAGQETWINEYFVDVACEDLDLLVVNQKSKLTKLEVKLADGIYDYHPTALDPIINKIFETLSKSAASRRLPLQVYEFDVFPTKVSEVMSVIRHMDQSELRDVWFRFKKRNEPGKIDDSVIGWNRDSGQKILRFDLNNVTREDLEAIASSQRFDEIHVNFESSEEENIEEFLDTKLFKLKIDGDCFYIYPLIERDYWSDKKKTDKLVESMEPSALSEHLALGVLGNSVIMENILGELEVFDIQRLRKVCRGVRECIDDVKPEPHINAYKVDISAYGISVNIESRHEARLIEYEYEYEHEYEKDALNDFHTNLLHQKTCLEELWIVLNSPSECSFFPFATKIGESLQRRKTALKVETFKVETKEAKEVMQILPCIDKDFLKKIIIIHQYIFDTDGPSTDLVEIARTEQWKRASELLIEECTVTTSIQEMNITHFSTVDIRRQTMSSDDVVYLKTELLKSSTLKKFNIKFKTSAMDGTLQNLIGEPYRAIPDVKKIWYFRMPYTNYYLHIVFYTQDLDEEGDPKPKTIVFSRVPKEHTPFF